MSQVPGAPPTPRRRTPRSSHASITSCRSDRPQRGAGSFVLGRWVLVIDDVFPPQDVELLREAVASPEVMRDWRKTEHATTTVHLLEIAVKIP